MARLSAAQALPSPRTHYRKRRRVRRTASGRSFTYNLRFPGQYYQAETGLNYNYMRDYDPLGGGRYLEADPIGLNGGINPYRYGYDDPIEYFDPEGMEPCFQLMCFPGFAQDVVTSSTLVDPGKWSLINVSVDPPRLLNQPPLSNPGGGLGALSAAQSALCFFAKTRSYKDEHVRYRMWNCLEQCVGCGGGLQWKSYYEPLGSYETIRREREQQVQQISAIIPIIRCMEILHGLH
jgi:RHS repeat-associated protein